MQNQCDLSNLTVIVHVEEIQKNSERRDEVVEMREEAGRSLRSLEQQIDALPDTDIKGLRELRRITDINVTGRSRESQLSRRSWRLGRRASEIREGASSVT